jgi:type I restriction enzyme, S subunit
MAETKHTKAFYNTEIPGDWDVKSMGEVATFINGKAYKQEELLSEGKYKVLRVGNFFTKGEWYYSDLELEDDKYVNDGDLMYAWSASFGPQFWKGEKTIYHYHIWKVIPSKLITKQFLFFLLDYDTQRILSSKQGGTMFHITKGDMEKRRSIIPPLPEQRAIAQVLSTADAAIHTTEKLIAQKELRKKWLMQQLLTGKKRLKGFEGEWKKERLEKYLVKHDEKSTVNNQYPVLTSSRRGIFLQSDYYTRDVASEDNTGYNVVPRGYFTYRHMSDDLIFKFNINDIVDKGIVSTLYPVFTTKDINSYFLLVKLNEGSEFKMHAEEQKQGGSRTYVYFKTLCQLKLNLPTIEEQTAIAQVLQAADKEINLLKAKAEKLREQKKGLMQQLLTGKKRLIF